MKRTVQVCGHVLPVLVVAAAVVALESFLLAADTPPPGADAQPPSLGALVVAGIGFLGLVILFIMIVVHKRSRKHKVEEPTDAAAEPESPELDESEEAGPDDGESATQ